MPSTPPRRVLVCADATCLKQTFVARANAALSDAGVDYRMMFTRGDWEDAALDQPLSRSIRFAVVPRPTDFAALPRLLLAWLLSPSTRAYLRATYKPELGKRLSLANAVIQHQVLRHARRFRPHVILAHFLWNLEAALALADALDVPVLGVAHGSDVLQDARWTDRVRHPRLRHVFCISQALREPVQAVLAKLGKTTSLLHNPVSPVYLEQAVAPRSSDLRVVCIATLRELKNHAWLFRALKLLHDRGVRFTCEIIGEPFRSQASFVDVLRRQADALGIAPHCQFVGWQAPQAARERIDDSTVLVLPSKSEGMGMVIVEAIARQRTPVGTDIPGIREAMFDGAFGYLCPLDDDAALAAALERAHRDTVSNQAWLEQGRRRVEQEFSAAHYAREFLARMDQIVPTPP